jgi:integrase
MHNYHFSITRYRNDEWCISLRINGRRHRYYNGTAIGQPDKPNLLPIKQRKKGFEALLFKFQTAINEGWSPDSVIKEERETKEVLTSELFTRVYEDKLKENLSYHFYKDLKTYINRLIPLAQPEISEYTFQQMVETHSHWSNTSFNKFARYASIIENGLFKYGYKGQWSKKTKRRRQEERLHKKITNLPNFFNFLKSYNKDLYLCALLTYGCLLRPHREVRELTWGDFNEDLTQISLAGNRNKGKRNRIVPVPPYVRCELIKGQPTDNIFTNSRKPYNQDYFSQQWQRFKRANPEIIEPGQTLYSLRHTGAIAVYEKTKNIKILQTVMGHSDMATSLTYLRGLEINELDVETLPELT